MRVRLLERTFNGNSFHVFVGSGHCRCQCPSSPLCLSQHGNRSVFTRNSQLKGACFLPSIVFTTLLSRSLHPQIFLPPAKKGARAIRAASKAIFREMWFCSARPGMLATQATVYWDWRVEALICTWKLRGTEINRTTSILLEFLVHGNLSSSSITIELWAQIKTFLFRACSFKVQ